MSLNDLVFQMRVVAIASFDVLVVTLCIVMQLASRIISAIATPNLDTYTFESRKYTIRGLAAVLAQSPVTIQHQDIFACLTHRSSSPLSRVLSPTPVLSMSYLYYTDGSCIINLMRRPWL
jgi:hypothetical protein